MVPAPTERPWLAFGYAGMHFECIDKLAGTLAAVRTVKVPGVSVPITDTIAGSVKCEDCGLLYQDFPMDITLPDNQWIELTGYVDGEGILCGWCIIKRAANKNKYVAGRLRFE